MRIRLIGLTVCLGVLSSGPAHGQLGRWSIGGGALVPAGEYSTHDKAGWAALLAFTPLRSGLIDLRFDDLYGRTPRKLTSAGTSQLFGLDACIVLRPHGARPVVPYALADLGYFELEEGNAGGGSSTPQNGLAIGGGAGVSFGSGSLHWFVEGRFIGGPTHHGVSFTPIMLGVTLGGS